MAVWVNSTYAKPRAAQGVLWLVKKYISYDRKVSVGTLKEEKHISDSLVESDSAGILHNPSQGSEAS